MILVTGGYGCIGAELTKWLLRNTEEPVLLGSRTVTKDRTQRVFHDVDYERLTCMPMDVGDADCVARVFDEYAITRVAHLAALQTPDCNANRDLGLQINLAATQHMVEICKRQKRKLDRFVFASSIAVYGPRASYPVERVPMLAEPNPVNVYGVWKLASEQLCQFFCEDTGIPTISLRPGVLFGPGRDAGLTSTPTMAMKCVALDKPYEIPFCSKQDYLYAPDVGAAFGHALMAPFDGYGVFTLPARTVEIPAFVSMMRDAAVEVGLADHFDVTHGQDEVPFICDLEFGQFVEAFPDAPQTDLADALRKSLTVFKSQVDKGWLVPADVG